MITVCIHIERDEPEIEQHTLKQHKYTYITEH